MPGKVNNQLSDILFTFVKSIKMESAQTWFKDWFNSHYYYQLYFKRDKKEAANFINKLVSYLEPPQNSLMLDVGCGRGRHSIDLASKGFDVTGIDLAEDSIRQAKEKENEHLHFFLHDMRLPFWINYFDYAFNFFTSFGYFNTRREHNNAIRTISESLKPDGVFVIDYFNVHFEEDHLVRESELEIDGVIYYITKWHNSTHFYKKILIKDDKLKAALEYHEKVVKFSFGDFTEMLAYHQMQVQEVFGDYNFENYDVKKSPRMIIVAKKIVRKT